MNNKNYIGSSVDLKRRFLEYFNIKRLLRYSSMAINKALLKYGYSQFSLSILEYCEVDELMIKEKYSLNLLSPKYNILKELGSSSRGSGWKHSKETKALNSHTFYPDYGEKTKKIKYIHFGISPKKKSLAPENAFSGLDLGIAFIQSQVFVVLSCSYIKDALELH